MSKNIKSSDNSNTRSAEEFIKKVGKQSARKIRSKENSDSAWFGLGMMGLIGWSIITPTLLGAALGNWLDKSHPQHRSWTLGLMVAGLCIGCLNAWHWMSKQHQDMKDQQGEDDD